MLFRLGRYALLIAIPVAAALVWFAPAQHLAIFIASGAGMVPLAGEVGRATERMAARFGGAIAGLLNATFGNAAELIIAGVALRSGLTDLVKASITGSIVSNVLLVFGAAALFAGIKREVSTFSRTAGGLGATMLLLSAIGLIVPAAFHALARRDAQARELELDTEIAVVLFVTYLLSLVFTLKTHKSHFAAPAAGPGTVRTHPGSIRAPVIRLSIAIALLAVLSEWLVGAVRDAAQTLGMTQLFVGAVVVAFAGNAAEHYSAVTLAARGDMDAALGIAIGSSLQIALFVAPVLVFLSYVIAPAPMDLHFTTYEVLAIVLAVLTIAFIAHDGETHWMEGVQLLAVYLIIALGFFFLP